MGIVTKGKLCAEGGLGSDLRGGKMGFTAGDLFGAL